MRRGSRGGNGGQDQDWHGQPEDGEQRRAPKPGVEARGQAQGHQPEDQVAEPAGCQADGVHETVEREEGELNPNLAAGVYSGQMKGK